MLVHPLSTWHTVQGSMAGLLTHGPRGLPLLLQLPLQGGHLCLEVTCFYGSRERGPSEAPLGLAGSLNVQCTPQHGGSPSRGGGVLGRCQEAWVPVHSASCRLADSLGFNVLHGGDLPNSLRPHNFSRSWPTGSAIAASLCLTASTEAKEGPQLAGATWGMNFPGVPFGDRQE